MFNDLANELRTHPNIEPGCLGIIANFMLMSSATMRFKEQQFSEYVEETIETFDYKTKDVPKTEIGSVHLSV